MARIAAHDGKGPGAHYDENEDSSADQRWKILLHHEKYHHGYPDHSLDVYIVFTGDGRIRGLSTCDCRLVDVSVKTRMKRNIIIF